jgi:hypothetical protein
MEIVIPVTPNTVPRPPPSKMHHERVVVKMSRAEDSSEGADASKHAPATEKRTADAQNAKTRAMKTRRYRPPDNRREWYERAESQLAISTKSSGKSRAGD